ncbi:MAG: trigger factor [Aggregatilineales bacterium]
MNIHVERLEDHTARLTVEVDHEKLDHAKQKAARQLSKRVNVPGFRKGKAPYRVILNYFGEGAILEDAVELLSNDVYREALVQSEVEPYGPGSLADFQLDPMPTLTFVVPLQPIVELNDYRSVRIPYEAPEIKDEAVDRMMRLLQEREALIEPSHKPAALGDRITADVHAYFIDAEPDAAMAAEAETPAQSDVEASDVDEEETSHDHPDNDDVFMHEHDAKIILDNDHEPINGFSDALVGAVPGDVRHFDITVAEDDENFNDIRGRTIHFDVTVKAVETVTLPPLNDDFAARLTADEEKPLTLLELRMRVRENMLNDFTKSAEEKYMLQALDAIAEQATIQYPEAMVAEEIERLLRQLDSQLRQQGITLDDYMKIYQRTTEDMYEQYRETAERNVRRQLVMLKLIEAERIDITGEDIDAEIERILTRFDEERREGIRAMFHEQSALRTNVGSDLLRSRTMERIAAIAKGEAPELVAEPEKAPAETGDAVATIEHAHVEEDVEEDVVEAAAANQAAAANEDGEALDKGETA